MNGTVCALPPGRNKNNFQLFFSREGFNTNVKANLDWWYLGTCRSGDCVSIFVWVVHVLSWEGRYSKSIIL